jgi:hypothetical protein
MDNWIPLLGNTDTAFQDENKNSFREKYEKISEANFHAEQKPRLTASLLFIWRWNIFIRVQLAAGIQCGAGIPVRSGAHRPRRKYLSAP